MDPDTNTSDTEMMANMHLASTRKLIPSEEPHGITPAPVQNAHTPLEASVFPLHQVWPFIITLQKIRDKLMLRVLFIEAIGSFWFIFMLLQGVGGYILGTALVAATGTPALGSWVSTIISLALAVTYGVYMSVTISGGHLSPAVTFTLVLWRRFPLRYAPFYVLAQLAGAIFAAICFYGLQSPLLDVIFMDTNSNRSITSAELYVNLPSHVIWNSGHLFINELLGDTIFMFIVAVLTDQRNPLFSIRAAPLYVGAAVFMVANTFGYLNFVLNPFRDFGPRIYLSAYYNGLWKDHAYWAIALFVPFLGHALGMLLYDVLVAKDYKDEPKAQGSNSTTNNVVNKNNHI